MAFDSSQGTQTDSHLSNQPPRCTSTTVPVRPFDVFVFVCVCLSRRFQEQEQEQEQEKEEVVMDEDPEEYVAMKYSRDDETPKGWAIRDLARPVASQLGFYPASDFGVLTKLIQQACASDRKAAVVLLRFFFFIKARLVPRLVCFWGSGDASLTSYMHASLTSGFVWVLPLSLSFSAHCASSSSVLFIRRRNNLYPRFRFPSCHPSCVPINNGERFIVV